MPTFLQSLNFWVLATLFTGLVLAMWRGAAAGYERGPLRAIASLVALAVAVAAGVFLGRPFGGVIFAGTHVPWLLRAPLGGLLLGTLVWLVVFGFIWWRGRSQNDASNPEHPVSGAVVGCWVGITWFFAGLLLLLSFAGIGEVWQVATGKVPWALRGPLRVKAALASQPGTAPVAAFNPVPAKQRELLRKVVAVLHNPRAFRRLQNDPRVHALAVNPAFYPLIENDEIKGLLRAKDVPGLLSHPLVIELLADEVFYLRTSEVDLGLLLDRALAHETH